MDLGSAIFGIISLACFIVPVILLQRIRNKERKAFLKDFMHLAEQQQLVISEHDFWNHHYAIGIDTQKNKLFYLQKGEGKECSVLTDLGEVAHCSLINANRVVNENKFIDRIALSFTFRNPKLAEKTLEFYNREESMSVNDELQLAEKWKALISSQIQKSSPEGRSVQLKRDPRRAA